MHLGRFNSTESIGTAGAILKTAIIIYESKYGNTEQVAQEIAAGMEETGKISCTLSKPKDFDPAEVTKFDAILFGCPVHMNRATRGIRGFIKKVGKAGVKRKTGALFETYMGAHNGRAIESMKAVVRNKVPGITLVSEGLSAEVTEMKGPLHEAEALTARDFGRNLGEKLLK